jgi:predicted phage terminase large subunit-like protein
METVSIRPQPGAQERFLSTLADIAIYGGAAGGGKSYALLMEPLRHIHNKDFSAVVLRKTTPEITQPGGLWEESEKIYPLVGAEPRIVHMDWNFPAGARVKFDHMEHEKSKHKYQGSQIALICFDELTHFTEGQFWYMVSRNRSTCGVRPYIRCTCNPDASSFVRNMVDWWIDPDTGYPIPERSGVLRWFVRYGGELQWGSDGASLRAEFGTEPKSLTFIPATLSDNPALTERDPGYRANLEALPYIEKERLLEGNWNVVDAEGAEWPAEYFNNIYVNEWPQKRKVTVVAFDPSVGKTDKARPGKPQGDFSAFVAVCKGYDDRYYVDADIKHRTISQAVEDGIAFLQYIRPDAFGVENIAFQEVVRDLFAKEVYRAGLSDVWAIHGDGGPKIAKKVVRIRGRITPLLHQGRIRMLRTPGTSQLLEQMRAFPIHKNDDGPDALEMAIRLADELHSGAAYREPEPEILLA